jgi:hypothetical protein
MTTLFSVLSILALLVALAAAAYAWRLQQETTRLTRRLDRYNKALFDAGEQLRVLREEARQAQAELRVALTERTGGVRFAPETTLREAQLAHPQVQEVLAAFHVGGCESCAAEADDTLARVCAERGIDQDALLGTLNALVSAGGSGNGGAFIKLPNVTIDFD